MNGKTENFKFVLQMVSLKNNVILSRKKLNFFMFLLQNG